ncbi:hypothetical protein F1721_31005 [Saccharopolyspora hirsuta]|uniref:Uncharacterized protein n=1 Tax=Saccharopolyspora hirsuta TaxID=1837 RepID=A0A5M7BAD2_SACHI|nr:hypothetical protein F1721_31005 [Saccharopolyspora hirsuta]
MDRSRRRAAAGAVAERARRVGGAPGRGARRGARAHPGRGARPAAQAGVRPGRAGAAPRAVLTSAQVAAGPAEFRRNAVRDSGKGRMARRNPGLRRAEKANW